MIADRASQFIDKSALTKGNTKEVERNSTGKKRVDRQYAHTQTHTLTYATQTQRNENEVKLNDNTNKRRTTLTLYKLMDTKNGLKLFFVRVLSKSF